MIIDELNRINRKFNRKNTAEITEAKIYSKTKDKYVIRLKNGTVVKRVPGPSGLQIGDYVMVAKTKGSAGFYTILGQSHIGFTGLKTVEV